MSFDAVLTEHSKKYPDMQPCDAAKLAYQACFGPEHMIKDCDAALLYLKNEYSQSPKSSRLYTEKLGRFSRIYLDSPFSEDELDLIGRMFIASAALPKGDSCELSHMLDQIEHFAAARSFNFTQDEFQSFRAEYEAVGCPALHHSESYRKAYRPSYRLIDTQYIRLLPLIFELARREHTVLAIDGSAASGKTTAAELLSGLFDCQIIHLDDFFLPPEMRTAERLAEPGGNMHRERFRSEVVEKLGSELSYRIFDCSTGKYKSEPKHISKARLTICEGAYSTLPELGKYYDISVFSTIGEDEQRERIIERNGEALWKSFRDLWIPLEERYFEASKIRERCDFII